MAQTNVERVHASLRNSVPWAPQVANNPSKTLNPTTVIVEMGFPPAAKGSEPLCRIVPMQHGFEQMLSFARMNSRVDFGPAVLPRVTITRHCGGPRDLWPIARRNIDTSSSPPSLAA